MLRGECLQLMLREIGVELNLVYCRYHRRCLHELTEVVCGEIAYPDRAGQRFLLQLLNLLVGLNRGGKFRW